MTTIPVTLTAGCASFPELFQHPVLEDGAPATTAEHARLLSRAAAVCRACPLAAQCLYDAVVVHDVAGFAGGTTAAQRRQLRARLGVRVAPENFDTLAGALQGNRPVDREEVLRVRRANPDETLEQLAMRLGCSTSTVKRHLRKERNGLAARKPATGTRPSVQQVWLAAAELTHGPRPIAA